MNDEEILRALRDRAKKEDDATSKAERLIREAGDEPELTEEERQMLRPLDAAAEQRIADAILGAPKPSAKPKPVLRAVPGETRGASRKPSVSSPSPWRWAPLVAAAAAGVVYFAWPRGSDVPKYALELSGNAAPDRADGPTIARSSMKVHRDATITIVFRPETDAKSKVVARAILVRDGSVRAWSPVIEVSPQGAVRISGPVKTLLPDTDAPWEVVLLVGPESAVPSGADAIARAANAPRADLRVARARIEFTP